MKLINPVGRSVSKDIFAAGQEKQPRACMCSGKKAFASTKGKDGCFHCGCSCSSNTTNSGNADRAFWTIRKSGSFE